MNSIDFTNCKRIIGKAYNGANGKKIAIEYDGVIYMLKFPPSGKDKPTELSYTNSCFSEHIASSIFNMIGINAQETILGTFRVLGKTKIVCACKDFTVGGKILYDFCSIKNTIIDSEHGGTGTELSDIMQSIEEQQFVNPTSVKEHFWNMFVVDALLGNFDRHNGNWGFLYDPVTQISEIAPVFDCGSSLLPQADEVTMRKVLDDEDEMNARIFQFPSSMIKEQGKKLRYYDFLIEGRCSDCNDALRRIAPKINMNVVRDFVDNVPYLSEIQRTFYFTYIQERWRKIILPAYRNLDHMKLF